jgi:hypothetical protein
MLVDWNTNECSSRTRSGLIDAIGKGVVGVDMRCDVCMRNATVSADSNHESLHASSTIVVLSAHKKSTRNLDAAVWGAQGTVVHMVCPPHHHA